MKENRYHSSTVVLGRDIRDDDAECIINAIKMIKCVLSVKPHVSDMDSHMAEARVRKELGEKLWRILYPRLSKICMKEKVSLFLLSIIIIFIFMVSLSCIGDMPTDDTFCIMKNGLNRYWVEERIGSGPDYA